MALRSLLDYCKSVNKARKAEAEEKGEQFVPFKPIVGCEAYCARRGRHSMKDDKATNGEGRTYLIDRSGWHLILLAKNMQGYRNLCKIVSAGFMADAFNYTPRIDREPAGDVPRGTNMLVGLSGWRTAAENHECLQPPTIAYRPARSLSPKGCMRRPRRRCAGLRTCLARTTISSLQRHETQKPGGDQNVYERQKEVNPVLIELARKYDVKIIATNDSHFVDEENAEAHDRLICLSTNHFVDDLDRMHYTKQEWLKTPEEMAAIFSDIPEALANTQEIADKVEIYDIDSGPIMPKFPIPEEFGTEEQYHEKFTEQEPV